MLFTNSGTNPDFYLWVFDLNTVDQRVIVNGNMLRHGDENGIRVTLTADGDGNCQAQWRVQTADGQQNQAVATESSTDPGGTTVEVSL